MAILDKQIQKKTAAATLEAMQEGRLPTGRELYLKVRSFLDRSSTGPSFYPRFQGYRKVWDYKATNLGLADIKFDLDVAYEEAVDQVGDLVRRLALVELSYSSQKTTVEQLIGALRNLLFVTKNAEDVFFGVYDTFSDLSKVNQSLTTRDAVDLSEGVVLLPQGDATSSRVDMSHLFSRASWPAFARALGEPVGRIIQNEVAPGSQFGNAFADFINSWRQLVTTTTGTGASLELTIPISGVPGQEISITRIAVTSSSAADIDMQVLVSTDNINFTKLPSVPDQVLVRPGKITAVDFEPTRVEFIRFVFKMTTPTVTDAGSFGYVFSFRGISFHRIGRTAQAEFTSIAQTPEGMKTPIDRVSISTIEAVPGGCSVDWFVAPADAEGNPKNDTWFPIAPIERSQSGGVPQIVVFGNLGSASVRLPATSPALAYDTVRQIDYYRLTEDPLDHSPKFGSALLWRGNNSWWRNKVRTPSIKEVRDVFVDFSSADTQNLYAVVTEQPDIESELTTTRGQGKTQTALTVTNEIDYDVATMSLTPPLETNPETDQRPRYAVYRVERFRDNMIVENETVTIRDDDSWAEMANTGIQGVGVGRPLVRNLAGSVTYVEGRDYILEVDPNSSTSAPVLTGRIKRRPDQTGVSDSNIDFGQQLKVSYALQSDITYMVDAARGNKVFLKEDLGEVADQYFQVTYRFVPRPNNNTINKATLVVTQNYGDVAGGTQYAEGPDYTVDAVQGTITRVPTGRIQGAFQVFVDFQYQQQAADLDTFSTWVRVDKKDPVKVEFNPIGLDIDSGERVWVDGVDVSQLAQFPEMSFGWHQIVVKSKRPETVNNAGINRVVTLYDRTNDPVFLAGGKYFAEILANRDPMIQRTYSQLTKATPVGAHNYFAITNDNHVIVNFEPSTTEEIYTYGLRRGESAESIDTDTWPEEFWLQYRYELDVNEPVRRVLVRATLNRNSTAPGSITPKIYEYHLRCG